MRFKIDRNVPVPDSRKRTPKYPFHKVKVGESFTVRVSRDIAEDTIRSLRSAASRYGRVYKMTFRVHRMSETEARCWRVA